MPVLPVTESLCRKGIEMKKMVAMSVSLWLVALAVDVVLVVVLVALFVHFLGGN